MRTNHTKDKLLRGETVFGCALQHFRSAEVPRVFAAAGFDYVFLDAEHTGFDLETLHDMVSASAQAGITPLVRPGELLYSLVARALDIGAQGVIFPGWNARSCWKKRSVGRAFLRRESVVSG